MSIYSDVSNDILFLRPNQDVDFEVAREMRERLATAMSDDVAFIILDFSLAAFVSVATLRVLLDIAGPLHRRNGCIAVTGASRQFRSLLDTSDVLKIVPAFQSIEEAQAYLLSFQNEGEPFSDEDDSEV
jgi:anti-anti-sigma factor